MARPRKNPLPESEPETVGPTDQELDTPSAENAVPEGDDEPVIKNILPPRESAPPSSTVDVRITKFGDGKVSTGVHIAMQGDVMAKQGDVLRLSRAIATSLEARGFGEIQ